MQGALPLYFFCLSKKINLIDLSSFSLHFEKKNYRIHRLFALLRYAFSMRTPA